MKKKKQVKKANKKQSSIQNTIDKILSDTVRQTINAYAVNQTYSALSQLDIEQLKLLRTDLNKMTKISSKNRVAKMMLKSGNQEMLLTNWKVWMGNLITAKEQDNQDKEYEVKRALFVEDIAEKLSQSEFELLKKYTGIEVAK